jgi:hypothetical protein
MQEWNRRGIGVGAIIAEETEEMVLIPKKDYIRYIESEKTLENIRKIVTDSDTGRKEYR